jgi:hypothetical protein
VRLDVFVVVAAVRLADGRQADRGAVRLDVFVLTAVRLTDGGQTDRRAVRLDVLWLWLWPILLTSFVRHYSSFRNFAVDSLDALSDLNLPWFASKTQSAL